MSDGKPEQNPSSPANAPGWPELEGLVRARTPARLLVGRAGAGYTTATQMRLRHDHAAAKDAVQREFDWDRDFDGAIIARHLLALASTEAASKAEYLMRPDLGRSFCTQSEKMLVGFPAKSDVQIAIGDGLSVTAMLRQAPALLDLLVEGATQRGWKLGRTFVIQHCRVGILNSIGELLEPKVVVLLIGERPGLATAESLSAYMAFRPQRGHTDADRNLISNIHERGVPIEQAAIRILNLAELMMNVGLSGTRVKESFGASIPGEVNRLS